MDDATALPQPEALAVNPDYGLSELGPEHMPLPDVLGRFGVERSWWVCTTRPDGRPHTMPVWGLFIDERLIFSTDPKSVKADNLAANAAIALHLESGDQVAIVEGTAVPVPVSDIPATFTKDYDQKYGFAVDPTEPGFRVFEVVPTKVFSWDERKFVETAARWRFAR